MEVIEPNPPFSGAEVPTSHSEIYDNEMGIAKVISWIWAHHNMGIDPTNLQAAPFSPACKTLEQKRIQRMKIHLNVFFDLSGSTLTKMSSRLEEFKKLFWRSGQGNGKRKPQLTTKAPLQNWCSGPAADSRALSASLANIEPCSSPAMCLRAHSC